MIDLSDTPAATIARLDAAIARRGQLITLKRFSPSATLTVKAVVRGFKPEELPAGVTVGTRLAIISPTSLVGSVFESDPVKVGDKAVVRGRQCDAPAVENVEIGDQIVRVNMWIVG